MPTGAIDSRIYGNLYGTAEMRSAFSDRQLLQHYLDVEVTLARVQAEMGIIPGDAAAEIAQHGDVDAYDLAALSARTEIVGYPILPLVEQLVARCRDGLGEFAHWGATTQDIMDCGTVLQLRDGLEIVDQELAAIEAALAHLAKDYRDTPMAGRTHLQHALPVTFGYKCAVWLAAVRRNRTRLSDLRGRVLVGQFSGAAGSLASLGDQGLAVQEALCRALDLAQPDITWHSARDGIAETVCFLGLVTGALAKIATDVMLMMQVEVAEAFEPFTQGRGASSTMPQKRNPIACELILATAASVRQLAAAALGAMPHDHERATGPWHVEWHAVPEAFVLTSGALHHARTMLEGLEVDPVRMRRNLDMTGGLIVAEAVMMGLAPKLGRQRAHDIVYDVCRKVLTEGDDFTDALAAEPEIAAVADRDRLAALTDPANYLGLCGEMVDRMLKSGPVR